MRQVFLIIFILCITTNINAQFQSKDKVAVYVTGQLDSTQKNIVSSKAISFIVRSKKFVALERNDAFLNAMVKEQDYQLSGEVSDNQIKKIGARFGAKYLTIFDVNISSDGYCLMTARLIDLETGEILKSIDSNRVIETTSDLIGLTNNVAYRLFIQSN